MEEYKLKSPRKNHQFNQFYNISLPNIEEKIIHVFFWWSLVIWYSKEYDNELNGVVYKDSCNSIHIYLEKRKRRRRRSSLICCIMHLIKSMFCLFKCTLFECRRVFSISWPKLTFTRSSSTKSKSLIEWATSHFW